MTLGIPVVDIFAGPGGLGEGFSSIADAASKPVFDLKVSLEKDTVAHSTLKLRAAFRLLRETGNLDPYYEFVRGQRDKADFEAHPRVKEALENASEEAHCIELGRIAPGKVDALIASAIRNRRRWILIGGPPCQAYSIAGRSRRTNDALFEQDEKHLLYKEYLRIIRKFLPPVFVMENVKGLLSSMHGGSNIFPRILQDLRHPDTGVEYEVRSFVRPGSEGLEPEDYVIRSEDYGVPQTRHRVILLGVRCDLASKSHDVLLPDLTAPSVGEFLNSMPRIRSMLSHRENPTRDWAEAVRAAPQSLTGWESKFRTEVAELMKLACRQSEDVESTGGRFVAKSYDRRRRTGPALEWIMDEKLGGYCQHESRAHMPTDLHRYLFAASFAAVTSRSPKLRDFPDKLLPAHENVDDEEVPFRDRFRVQLEDKPSSTVVSHIAKDGHYYIHYDPVQCRSLTVREAARLQTFPDNYWFEGNKTQQYGQVGNAVPPYLARQLAISVAKLLGAVPETGP